jgi:glycosyltransferase involved in cell wall biosynthesis
MNVFFYAGRFSHPFFREQFRHAPDGVNYVPSTPDLLGEGFKSDLRNAGQRLYRATRKLSRKGVQALGVLGIPRTAYAFAGGAELIHSSRHLLMNRRPWVVEVEMASALAWYSRRNLERPVMRRAIERRFASPWCRRILPWTEAAKKSLLHAFDCRPFADKIKVVYPAIAAKPVDFEARRRKRELTLLFVGPGFYGAGFYNKGGVETLLAFEQISPRYPELRLEMVCLPPENIRARWGAHPKITFRSRIPQEELDALYRRADIFILPTHMDTLGFVYLEAFSCGVPCIGTRQFAVPEIITDGVTGFVVDNSCSNLGADYLPRFEPALYEGHPLVEECKQPPEPYVTSLAEQIARLVEDSDLRSRMSAAAYEEVVSGKFSVARRKRALRRIYEESLTFAPLGSAVRTADDDRVAANDERVTMI